MSTIVNPFVDYLGRYTTASPDHEAAFDEFLAQAAAPAGGPLSLRTQVEGFLVECFQGPHPPSVILTGNAGDGKTYLCRQTIAAFTGYPLDDWDTIAGRSLERDGIKLTVIKDLSELGEEHGTQSLQRLAATLEDPNRAERFLIAANEGRLRYLLRRDRVLNNLHQLVDRQLQQRADTSDRQLVVINLTETSTASLVSKTLHWMTQPVHWSECERCPINRRCPLQFNAMRLRDERVSDRMRLLYQILEYLDIHVTIRDMLIHLAYTLTGNRRCEEVQQLAANRADLSFLTYYENMRGRADDHAFQRKSSVVQHFHRLHIGDHSLFEIDDFIVTGGQTETEQQNHSLLFQPAVDLDDRRFIQDRETYLSGRSDSTAAQEEQALMRWLPRCRRKLFFEWHDGHKIRRLIPFLYLHQYEQLLQEDRGIHDTTLRQLVTGLNRAFSRLYLTDEEYLFVTTQFLHTNEQSRPLVRLRFPLSDLWLEAAARSSPIYSGAQRTLRLIIAPPAQLRRISTTEPLHSVTWPIGLLQFEYLMRLASGGTYNILAEECELSIRKLKDHLLMTFAAEPESGERLEFFVAERHRYSLKKLWIDEHGTIRG